MTAPPLAHVDGQSISIRDRVDLLRILEARFDGGLGFSLYTLNLDHLVKRRQSASFRAVYSRATFVTADGWPVVALARREDPAIKLTTGADLVIPVCRLAARRRIPVYLYGSRQQILVAAAMELRRICPGLDVVGCDAPPPEFDPLAADGRAAMTRIGESGARLCFVALGAPKQEFFSDAACEICPKVGFVCVGAALDFVAGARRRAPRLVRDMRLEWAWRLAAEPRRLSMRYMRCALLFARLTFRPTARP